MYEIYNVVSGDTIESISKMFDSSVDDIIKINGLDKDYVIEPGMQLVVPKKKVKGNFLYYTVKKGDSPYYIAKEYGVDYKVLLALNGLDEEDYIYPNQTIIVPDKDVNIYMTRDNDTIDDIVKRYDTSIDYFIKDNENIYLKPEQIIVFRNK